jgi:murein DD-endopeptidase MepM/ murein hydrolase activator NlpD
MSNWTLAPARATTTRAGTALCLLAVIVVVGLAGAMLPRQAAAQTSDDAAKRAAQEIQDARDRANAIAEQFFKAQSDLEVLKDDFARLKDEESQLANKVSQLKQDVESVALGRFVDSGAGGIPLLTGLQAPKDQVQAEVFVDVLTNNSASALDEYDAARKDLAAKQSEVADRQSNVEAQQKVFTALQAQAEAEVVRLRKIEEERLKDEAVKRALKEQQAAALSRLEEQTRRAAEAAAKARPNPGLAQLASDSAPSGGDNPDGGDSSGPVETIAPKSGASGGTSGGRTGTGGIGSSSPGYDSGAGYIANVICPIVGAAYGDTWGAPRSGGRRHEGVDMLAPRGTPIIAAVSGTVIFKQNVLGGNAVSLVGDDGNRYYYAHLSAYEGSSRRVAQGDVIGYNGDTGDAAGTPHLHFEVHPGGGLAVDPTPTVRAAGC